MSQAIEELRNRLAEISDLETVSSLAAWDQATMMPARGAEWRAYHLATLARITHERATDDEIGRLLDRADAENGNAAAESIDSALLRVTRRDYTKAKQVPLDLAADLAHTAAAGYAAWTEARAASDFDRFLPFLEKNIELKHRYIECFDPSDSARYDILIDDFEEGLTAVEITTVFNELKAGLVPLIKRVSQSDSGDPNNPMTSGSFPTDKQKELELRVIRRFGYDDAAWRLDPTAHPFAQSLATSDIRLTTRYDERNLAQSFFGTIHECGHGLYEAGIDPALERTPLCRGGSMSLHESQSRLYENLVGRGRPFWDYAIDEVRSEFPEQFRHTDAEAVFRAVNRMRPSLIRVEADELTYPMHIILRFELESELFGGSLQPRQLPDAWNAKMKEYLDIDVPDVADGVLQDVHWSAGLFGYFPTYALGTVISVQIWDRIKQSLPDLDDQFRRGEFLALREWLKSNLHQFGRRFAPKEMIARVAGGPIDSGPYVRYLTAKVDDLYGAA